MWVWLTVGGDVGVADSRVMWVWLTVGGDVGVANGRG